MYFYPTHPSQRCVVCFPCVQLHQIADVNPKSVHNIMSVSGNHSDPGGSFFPTSDSKHYPLVIHHNVSSGASSRALVEKCSPCGEYIPQPPNYVSPGVPPWVHVFAKSATASSLRTQAVMIAHTEVPFSHKVHHKRILRLFLTIKLNYFPSTKSIPKWLFLMEVMTTIPPYVHPMESCDVVFQ